jgi:hypothetical protein
MTKEYSLQFGFSQLKKKKTEKEKKGFSHNYLMLKKKK